MDEQFARIIELARDLVKAHIDLETEVKTLNQKILKQEALMERFKTLLKGREEVKKVKKKAIIERYKKLFLEKGGERTMSFKDRLTSRKFLSMVGAVLIALGSAVSGAIVWSQAIWTILLAVLAYIGVEGMIDLKSTKEGSVSRK